MVIAVTPIAAASFLAPPAASIAFSSAVVITAKHKRGVYRSQRGVYMHNKNVRLNFLFMKQSQIDRVDKLRQGLHWSWAEFARQIGESPQVVNNWIKRGRIPGEKHYAVAKAIGTTVEWIIEGERSSALKTGEAIATKGAEARREPVYPIEPFNRFSKLAQLWPYLTDEVQADVLDKVERIVTSARHGLHPPTPTLKREPQKTKK
jgi:DNA-binding transcriptional regulator YiaG